MTGSGNLVSDLGGPELPGPERSLPEVVSERFFYESHTVVTLYHMGPRGCFYYRASDCMANEKRRIPTKVRFSYLATRNRRFPGRIK